MMDLGEEEQNGKNDQSVEDSEDKDIERKTSKSSGNKKSRKLESTQRGRNSRPNSRENRRESSRSRSRSRTGKMPITSAKNSWKSANAWLNFMQDFRANLRGFRGMRNASVFRLAAEQWSQMSPAQKKPYVDAANKAKRKKRLENGSKEVTQSKSKKRPKPKKLNAASNVSNSKKNNHEEDTDRSDSEYDSVEESSMKNLDSDNGSCDTDGSA